MWILARLLAACIGIIFRFVSFLIPSPPLKNINGIDYVETLSAPNEQRGPWKIGLPFDCGVVFAMTRENIFDKMFKILGFSREFQTGNAVFDAEIYIACDHPFFCKTLKDNAEARSIILQFFEVGFERVWTDGKFLCAKRRQPIAAGTEQWVPQLDILKQTLTHSLNNIPNRWNDTFAWKVLLVESVIWSIAGYSAVAFVEFGFHNEDYHLNMNQIYFAGLFLAATIFAWLLFMIAMFLQRSSRSHRILFESGFLLLFSLPILGVQGVSDLNRGLDTSPPFTVDTKVARYWATRGRRLPRTTYYHMSVTSQNPDIQLPEDIDISREVFQGLQLKKIIQIEIGNGALGIAWYRKINGIEMLPK